MFNFFKSKTTIAELITLGFIDIHSHILTGIDDGAKNTSDSVQLLSEFQQLGFSKVIGTPHTYKGVHDNTNASIKSSFDRLNEQDLPNVVIGYASVNTNRVTIPVSTTEYKHMDLISFNAGNFKEILSANKECESALLEVSPDGIARITFKIDNYKSTYYLVAVQDVD